MGWGWVGMNGAGAVQFGCRWWVGGEGAWLCAEGGGLLRGELKVRMSMAILRSVVVL